MLTPFRVIPRTLAEWNRWIRAQTKIIGTGGGQTINGDLTISGNLTVTGNVNLTGLPTSDPAVAGRLWNDTGTVKISAG